MTELLAPAGDLEKLKVALMYGADAVYIGGKHFSLRARASNFDIPDIKEAVDFAHSLGKKIYITLNIIPHNEDFDGLIKYLKDLESVNIDAVICASLAMLNVVKEHTNLEIHISTQQSVTNSKSIEFFKMNGATRVVLARELTMNEIVSTKKNSPLEIEAFIHGGMCVSYSGRCMLSNNMTNRDANRGGCAHSCRWNYDLYIDDKNLSDATKFSMSSKDLCAVDYITSLLDAKVDSLKIEGRMKSIHYIATVVGTYRKLINDYSNNKLRDITYYKDEIKKAENRLTSVGFFGGTPTIDEHLYDMRAERPNKLFVAIVKEYNHETKECIIEQRNYFTVEDDLEIYMPEVDNIEFKIDKLYDLDNNDVDVARHPKQLLKFRTNIKLKPYYIIRLKK